MTSNWTTIGEIAEVFDGPHATPKKTDEGPVFLGIGSLNKGSLDLSKSEYLSEEDFEKWTKRVTPRAGDVVFSYETRLGEAAIIPEGLRCCLGRRMGLLRPKLDRVLPEYLLYAYLSPEFQSLISARTIHGSTVDRIALKDLPNFPVQIPPVEKQRLVIDILKGLDDKIELNRQINQTLEQIAQTIFKSWFVDFEPVKTKIEAKAAGRDPERAAMCAISGKLEPELDQLSPEQYQQLAASAALFPDELVESELGVIPSGWDVGRFEKFCVRVESGGTPSRAQPEYWNGSVSWLTSGEVRDVIVLDTKEKISEKGLASSSAKLWPAMSTVVAMYGATAGQICLLASEMSANQACCALIPKKEYQNFVFFSARRSIEDLAGKASGSAQQNLNKSLVANHAIVMPPSKTANLFETTTLPLIEQWISCQRESQTLATLRDTLLPKLLSGELHPPSIPPMK